MSDSSPMLTDTSMAELNKASSSDRNLGQYVMSRTNWFKFLKHVFDELCAAGNSSELVERDLLAQTLLLNSDKIPLQPLEVYKQQFLQSECSVSNSSVSNSLVSRRVEKWISMQ